MYISPAASRLVRKMFVVTHLWSLLFLLVSPQFQTALFAWTSGRVRRRGFWCQSHGRLWAVRRERAGPPQCWNPRPTPTDPAEETRLRASGETKEAYRKRQRQRCLMGEGRGKTYLCTAYHEPVCGTFIFQIICQSEKLLIFLKGI